MILINLVKLEYDLSGFAIFHNFHKIKICTSRIEINKNWQRVFLWRSNDFQPYCYQLWVRLLFQLKYEKLFSVILRTEFFTRIATVCNTGCGLPYSAYEPPSLLLYRQISMTSLRKIMFFKQNHSLILQRFTLYLLASKLMQYTRC